MQRYNFFRPLLIILVAFLANNIARLVCSGFGVDPQTTDSIAIGVMVIAALFTYTRLTRNQRKK